ncbi:ATPase PAAT-like [Sorex fumeus]|uniref:ATPase PAAT-like n=1 Tax=Sorex fumeus TaxID=62283 RepID=UPI0024ACE19F|nr:ATPase PAAT-like [Sorex fumeus]
MRAAAAPPPPSERCPYSAHARPRLRAALPQPAPGRGAGPRGVRVSPEPAPPHRPRPRVRAHIQAGGPEVAREVGSVRARRPGGNASAGRRVPPGAQRGAGGGGGGGMEAGSEAAAPSRLPALASSWAATRGSLARSLRVSRAGAASAGEPDCDELLAPAAPGQDVVVLRRAEGQPCFLDVRCPPGAGEELLAVGVLSSARNMEVYQAHGYCGTARGRPVGAAPASLHSENEIVFYKKYLKLEPSTNACKIKLLSLGEQPCVCISTVGVHLRRVAPEASPGTPPLSSTTELERIQTLVATMGSKLSPGAQQLMSVMKFQQQNHLPLGEQLWAILGNAAPDQRAPDPQPGPAPGAAEKVSCTPFPFRAGLASAHAAEEPPVSPGPEPALLEASLRRAVSTLPPKNAGVHCNGPGPGPDLLPFLQDLCSQVSHLRAGPKAKWQEPLPGARDGLAGLKPEEPPVCAQLERILCRNLGLLERQLRAHIDERLLRLQEHLDDKLAALLAALQSPACPPEPASPAPASPAPAAPLPRWDSGEKLSNGESSYPGVL